MSIWKHIMSKKILAANTQEDTWLNINTDCLETWTCSRNIYETLNIREDIRDEERPFDFFVTDIFLSATFFIGTVITFALVFSGLLITWWWASESTVQRGKDGVKYSLLWLALVIFSYTIIRGVQFVAQGQG